MPRKSIFPPYPTKPHSSGQARIAVRGRSYYLGKWGSQESKQEYARLMAELARPGAIAPPPDRDGLTVAEVLARWLVNAEEERAGSRELKSFREVIEVVNRLYGHTPAASFGVDQLRAVRSALVSGSWLTEEEKAKRTNRGQPVGWCRNVTNRQVVRIRTLWRWAEETAKIVPPGSWGHLCALRPIPKTAKNVRQTPPVEAATWEQVSAVMPHVAPAVAVMLELQWWTGMRPGELVRMRAGDVDRDGPDGHWLYRLGRDKNSWRDGYESPPVVLGPEARRVLGPWLDAIARQGPDTVLFPSSRRKKNPHYTEAAYNRAVSRACEAHGIPHFTPYQIRHAVKDRVTRECDLDAARSILRQQSIGTTNSYGRQRDLKIATRAAEKAG